MILEENWQFLKVIEQIKSFFAKVQQLLQNQMFRWGRKKLSEMFPLFTSLEPNLLVGYIGSNFSQDFMAQFTSEFLNLHQFPASRAKVMMNSCEVWQKKC